MIYIRFIHPELEANSTYQAWLTKKNAGRSPDWKELFDWLSDHPRVAYQKDEVLTNQLPKCWFSEMPVGARHGKDVEHFRPKNRADQLSPKQRQSLAKVLGYLPDLAPAFPSGYKWLEYEPINYRLAHPHVNRSGAKYTHFPLLAGTARLANGVMPDVAQRQEYAYLLDPSDPRDQDLLLVLPDGAIVPRDPIGPKPSGQPEEIWHTPAMKHIRAQLSIIVYQLNHADLKRGRKGVYAETQETLQTLRLALQSGLPNWVSAVSRKLFRLGALPSRFALAARCAMEDVLGGLRPTDPLEQALATTLQRLLQQYQSLERLS